MIPDVRACSMPTRITLPTGQPHKNARALGFRETGTSRFLKDAPKGHLRIAQPGRTVEP
jgi:hypothetical protein